ncbi:hypothetical protein FSP39_007882 [Pinctada imbricata]|uniref:Dehydrogenase/reductase SDR family member 11 n=1 Tax=Pinctada imbricata TaxID=66713 RepID=A0AA88XT27_PINIB|nr:hypothetical protein FSP39_007882 [Pinctada imbricata]
MERWVGRVALVTGASVGIGAAISRKLVQNGMTVVGCARNVEQIQEIANDLKSEKGKLIPMRCDLTREEDILDVFGRVKKELGGVDVMVNNAGLSHNAPLLTGSTQDWRNMLEVNVLALSICSREAVKQMRERNVDDGHIFLVSSMSGHRVIPNSPGHFYSATKHAVKGLTDGLRNELREIKSHIRVTALCPGLVHTEFQKRMYQSEEMGNKICSMFKCLEADDVADALVYALGAPPHVQIHDILFRPTEQIS